MNWNCKNCNIERDENIYLKDRTVCKSWYNKKRGKNNNNSIMKNQQPNSIKSTKTKTTSLMFQHMKFTPMLLLAQETLVKLLHAQNTWKIR